MVFPDPAWLHAGDNTWRLAAVALAGIVSLPGFALSRRRGATLRTARAAVVGSRGTSEDRSRVRFAVNLAPKGGQP